MIAIFPLLTLAGCSSTLSNRDAPAPGPSAGPTVWDAKTRAYSVEREPLWIPEVARHDPAARSLLMEQLRVQVMQKTRHVPEVDRLVVRERLRRQLNHAGFFYEEVIYILSSLDGTLEGSQTPRDGTPAAEPPTSLRDLDLPRSRA
jgi:hypothetical protein